MKILAPYIDNFDAKSLIAHNSLNNKQNKIWLKNDHFKYDATITVRSDFLPQLSTKLSTGFVDNQESDYTTIS